MAIESTSATPVAWATFFGQFFRSRAGFFAGPMERLDSALNAIAAPSSNIDPQHHEGLIRRIV